MNSGLAGKKSIYFCKQCCSSHASKANWEQKPLNPAIPIFLITVVQVTFFTMYIQLNSLKAPRERANGAHLLISFRKKNPAITVPIICTQRKQYSKIENCMLENYILDWEDYIAKGRTTTAYRERMLQSPLSCNQMATHGGGQQRPSSHRWFCQPSNHCPIFSR